MVVHFLSLIYHSTSEATPNHILGTMVTEMSEHVFLKDFTFAHLARTTLMLFKGFIVEYLITAPVLIPAEEFECLEQAHEILIASNSFHGWLLSSAIRTGVIELEPVSDALMAEDSGLTLAAELGILGFQSQFLAYGTGY